MSAARLVELGQAMCNYLTDPQARLEQQHASTAADQSILPRNVRVMTWSLHLRPTCPCQRPAATHRGSQQPAAERT